MALNLESYEESILGITSNLIIALHEPKYDLGDNSHIVSDTNTQFIPTHLFGRIYCSFNRTIEYIVNGHKQIISINYIYNPINDKLNGRGFVEIHGNT